MNRTYGVTWLETESWRYFLHARGKLWRVIKVVLRTIPQK